MPRALALVLCMLLTVQLAGCFSGPSDDPSAPSDGADPSEDGDAPGDGPTDETPPSDGDGTDDGQDTPRQRPPDEPSMLLWTLATEALTPNSTVGEDIAWTEGYHSPDDGTIYVAPFPDDEPDDRTQLGTTDLNATYPDDDLRPWAGIDAHDAVRSAARELAAGANMTQATATYWLAAYGGQPRWTVVVDNGTDTAAWTLDATDHDVVSDRPAAPPVPSRAATLVADQLGSLWADDARLIEVVATESPSGGFGTVQLDRVTLNGSVVPPDTAGGDGRAPQWHVLVYSPSNSLVRPLVVNGGSAQWLGTGTPVNNTTVDGTDLAGLGIDSAQAARKAFLPLRVATAQAASYHLTVRDGSPVWRVVDVDAPEREWWVHADSGEVVRCAPSDDRCA